MIKHYLCPDTPLQSYSITVLIHSNAEWPCEGIKHAEAKQKSTKWDQEGSAEIYADMIIYTIGPATLVPTMRHHKLTTTIVTSLTLSNFWYLILS